MAASPPKYQRLTQLDDEEGLENQVTYPPVGASNANGGVITYIFEPRWPIKAKREEAVGVIGADRLATAAIVRRTFVTLEDYPLERIEFLAPTEIDESGKVPDGKWGIVMEEAWAIWAKSGSPRKLTVRVKDLPGETEARDKHDKRTALTIVASIITTFMVIGGLAITAAAMVDDAN